MISLWKKLITYSVWEEEILRFDISMNDMFVVKVFERFCYRTNILLRGEVDSMWAFLL